MEWDSTEKDLIYHEQYYKLSKAYTASYLVIKTNLLINIKYLSVLFTKKERKDSYLKEIKNNIEFTKDRQALDNYKPPFTFCLKDPYKGKQEIKVKLNNDLKADDIYLILNFFQNEDYDKNYLIETKKLYKPVSIDYELNQKVYTYTCDLLYDNSVRLISISIQSENLFDYCSILVKNNSKLIKGLNWYLLLVSLLLIIL